ncbi:alpha/beta hydrolase family protein [Georgenia soli]|uniref:Alpha/beta hydrolase family protein n=1 Tax=Georgenia soli TaxID=638953 RepID=A0A2A9EPI3_9MICO|nr:alpha/beta hydrolase [Georgenia soli]PFG40155.1 alpha/beta hydrolase family protein [Georgenia soli]
MLLGPLLAALVAGGGSAAAVEDRTVEDRALGDRAVEERRDVPVPELAWAACGTTPEGTAAGVQCATATLPIDYDDPDGEQVGIAVARVPARDAANRVGSLFVNLGGPGGTIVDVLQRGGGRTWAALNQRFDLVGVAPRGVGQSTPAVDCQVNPEELGVSAQPFPTPLDIDVDAHVARAQAYVDSCLANNGDILAHVSTANVARDMDLLRAAVGDEQLTYLGYSYGTFLGATYAALFPEGYRALVLDSPVDLQQYVDDPLANGTAQTAAFERELQRFFEACAKDQGACSGFGGARPSTAYDALVALAERAPIPAPRHEADPRPVDGDDIRVATTTLLYSKQLWGILGAGLAQAAAGDASVLRLVVDLAYNRQNDGSYAPGSDQFFAISAAERHWPRDIDAYLDKGAESWAAFPHFWYNSGYSDTPWGLWPVRDEDAYEGPFTVPASSPTPLVVATTYDPATPYNGGVRTVHELGNARLVTMRGDGHGAYPAGSPCVNAAVESYLVDLTLPAEGLVCEQTTPFTAPQPAPAEVPADAGALLDDLGALLARIR